MIKKKVVVQNQEGIHLRPAATIVKELQTLDCKVTIVRGGNRILANSIIDIAMAGIQYGEEIVFECEGAQEKPAMKKIEELEKNGFGEVRTHKDIEMDYRTI